MNTQDILSEVEQAISNRPAGTCDRWAVGLLHNRVRAVPYLQRYTLELILFRFSDRYAFYGLSPAARSLVLGRMKQYEKEKCTCQQPSKP